MTHNLKIALVLLAVVMLPFSLIVRWLYREIQQADEPVPAILVFQAKFWNADLYFLLFISCVPLYGLLTMSWILVTGGEFAALVMVVVMGCLCAPSACYFWLNWTYWQYDRYNELTFYRPEKRFVYHNNGYDYSYNFVDVVKLTTYRVRNGRVRYPFAYTILTFSNGQELLITYLLYDRLGSLLSAAQSEEVIYWLPWLPEFTVAAEPL